MHSGQTIDKIFTCVRYLTGLEKLPGAVLLNVGRRSNEEAPCQFIGNSMLFCCELLANPQSYMHSVQNIDKLFTCVRYLTGLEKFPGDVL